MISKQQEVLNQFDEMQLTMSAALGCLANPVECQEMVSFLEQNEKMLPPNVFYILVDNKISKISWSMRLFKYLGYPDVSHRDTALSVKEVLSWIRPEELPVFLSNALSVYEEANKNGKILQSYKKSVSYQIEVHMRNYNGKYFHLLQQSIPMGFDENCQLISHLNIYTIIADGYRPNVMPLSQVYIDPSNRHPFNEIIHDHISEVLSKFQVLNFNYSHKQIIKAYKEDSELTVLQLVNQLRLSEHSIRKYQKDILQKINAAFGMTFTSLKPALQSLFISRIL